MDERRNHYRVLGVQPDAPAAAIRSAYRVLMQKLRAHPDLGGDAELATAINVAYSVLRDRGRRDTYDKWLLERWNLVELGGEVGPSQAANDSPAQGNRRNFYRLLGVQPDAHIAVIRAAYREAVKSGDGDQALVREAFEVLADEPQRRDYDRWLRMDGHRLAAARLAGKDSLIATFCPFCKAPHREYPQTTHSQKCHDCGSPINLIDLDDVSGGRFYPRLAINIAVQVDESWPVRSYQSILLQLTPTGAQLQNAMPLTAGCVLRLRSDVLDIVATIVHCEPHDDVYRCGLRLLAAAFAENGLYVNATA